MVLQKNLAEDEQVRRLISRPQFRIETKGLPARGSEGNSNKPDLSSIIRSVESAIEWAQKIEESDTRRQRTVGYHRGNTQTEIEDLRLDDYAKFINELKESLTEYAKEKNNAVLLDKANLLLHGSIRF